MEIARKRWSISLFALMLFCYAGNMEAQQAEVKEELSGMEVSVVLKNGEQRNLSNIQSWIVFRCRWGKFLLDIPLRKMDSFESTGGQLREENGKTVAVYTANVILTNGKKLECSFKRWDVLSSMSYDGLSTCPWHQIDSAKFSNHPVGEAMEYIGTIVDVDGHQIELQILPASCMASKLPEYERYGIGSSSRLDRVMRRFFGKENIDDRRVCLALPNGGGVILLPASRITQVKFVPDGLQISLNKGKTLRLPFYENAELSAVKSMFGSSDCGQYVINCRDIREFSVRGVPSTEAVKMDTSGVRGVLVDKGGSSHELDSILYYYFRYAPGLWLKSTSSGMTAAHPSEYHVLTQEIAVRHKSSEDCVYVDLSELRELHVYGPTSALKFEEKSGVIIEGYAVEDDIHGTMWEDKGFIGRTLLNGSIEAWMYIPVQMVESLKFR